MFTSEFEFDALRWETPGEIVRVGAKVPADLRYFEGHFPGDPIVPGVAQLGPLAEAQARRAWPELGALVELKRLKFMHAIRPGDALELELTRKGQRVVVKVHKRRDPQDAAAGTDECTRGTFVFA